MGLLDDAIRQHLELKRRHGADPGEVAELEREALGPVRRGEALRVPVEAPAAEVGDDHAAADPQGPSGSSSISRAEEASYQQTVGESDPDVLAESTETHGLAVDEEASYEETLLEADEQFEQAPAPAPAAAPADPAEEDVLEETPEFLQETPEHDRLWFEQKPPRDFDF